MGKPPTKQAAAAKAPATGGSQKAGKPVLLLLVVVLFAIVSLPTVMIVGAGMLPTLVAYLVDRQRPRYAVICVGGLNIAGVFPHLLPIWFGVHTTKAAEAVLTDVFVLVSMYGAALFGWMLDFAVPPLVGAVLSVMAQRRVALLRLSQKALIEEWGESVANPADAKKAPSAPPPEPAPEQPPEPAEAGPATA